MKRKRRKGELAAKDASRIAKIISFIFLMILFIILFKARSEILDYIVACMSAITLWIVIYILIFRGDKKEFEEENIRIGAKLASVLSKTDFKEVQFQLTPTDSATMMLLDILEKEQVKFYARLVEDNDGIIIQCIDKHGDMVHESKITNFSYFEKYFKVS